VLSSQRKCRSLSHASRAGVNVRAFGADLGASNRVRFLPRDGCRKQQLAVSKRNVGQFKQGQINRKYSTLVARAENNKLPEDMDADELMRLADDDYEEEDFLDDGLEALRQGGGQLMTPNMPYDDEDEMDNVLAYDDETDDDLLVEFDLKELLDGSGIQVKQILGMSQNLTVSGVEHDSRRVTEGNLFVCHKGMTVDGHAFAQTAVEKGAAVVIVSDLDAANVDALLLEGAVVVEVEDSHDALVHLARVFYGDPSKEMTVVGVTGTNGKTTTTCLIKNVLEAMELKCGLIGTIQYLAGDTRLTPEGDVWVPDEHDTTKFEPSARGGNLWPYRGRYDVPNTTPDALQLQQLYAGMAAEECTAVVMEASSHALALGRTNGTSFDIAVFTNLTRDHLDFHGSFEEYREAKLKLFRELTDPDRQRAVINLDDPEAHHFIKAASKVPIITYSMENSDAAVYAESVELSLFETAVLLKCPEGDIQAVSGLLGRFNVSNMLAAAAVGVALGAPLETIAYGIENCEAVPGRFEMIDEGQPFAVITDYAHTPDALERVLLAAREIGARRILLVFGAGGDRDRGKRPMMGRIAHELADVVFVCNDNPRTECLQQICADIVSGFPVELHNAHPEANFNWLQDMWHTRHTGAWDEMGQTLELQNDVRRYILEERFYAIRIAIAMADEGDAVIIAGKGHEDYLDWKVDWVDRRKHWFDDRQEARDTLQRVVPLQEAGVDTRNLPWDQVNR